ncbi:MAG: DNA repair protein RecN [Pseudomonadota bacterium]
MLTQLSVKHFALIDKLNLELHDGMTCITGETGAGKSMMIGALELVLGLRSPDIIKSTDNRVEITAAFDVNQQHDVKQYLQAQQLDQDNDCVIRRSFDKHNRSRCFINDTPTTLQKVRQLGRMLLTVHGQHQHQLLFDRDYQRRLLDAFAGHQPLNEQIANTYRQWRDIEAEIDALQSTQQNGDNQIDFLRYQLEELETLNLNITDQLEKEHHQLAHAEELVKNGQAVINDLNDDQPSLLDRLHHHCQALEKFTHLDKRIANTLQLLNEASVQIQEANNELKDFLSEIEINPQRLSDLEHQLSRLHDIANKHRVTVEELPTLVEKLKSELDAIEHYDEKRQVLTQTQQKIARHYQKQADALHQSREKAAIQLSKQVTANMHKLAMPHATFHIEFNTHEKFTAHGQDKINFLVSINPGQKPQPLDKIVSGGELSRISLAIQVITAKKYVIPTLIFDEVDVGIGGPTADIVGALLKELAKNSQILTITHLGQIAGKSQQHLKVNKAQTANGTRITIDYLEGEQRTEELARMIGGIKISEQARQHAKEMLTAVS